MKHLALFALTALVTTASAQPANQPKPAAVTPQAKRAVIDAEVVLIGCSPMRAACGILMSRQPVAIKVTKVDAGPLKVGETAVVDVVTCFEGPLLHRPDPVQSFVALDERKIRMGSKIHLEVEVYPSGNLATTDNITVTKL